MDKIEELTEHAIIDRDGNCYGMEMPCKRETMNKINELVRAVNRLADETPHWDCATVYKHHDIILYQNHRYINWHGKFIYIPDDMTNNAEIEKYCINLTHENPFYQ